MLHRVVPRLALCSRRPGHRISSSKTGKTATSECRQCDDCSDLPLIQWRSARINGVNHCRRQHRARRAPTRPIGAELCASMTTDEPARRTRHRFRAEHVVVHFAPHRKALPRLAFRPVDSFRHRSLHFFVHRLKPNTSKACSPSGTGFGTCVMSVPFQGEISMTIHNEQLTN